MTSRMIVHGIPGSPYVRAALLALEEKGAAYELAAMQFGTLKQQPHLSRHPFGRIPAFEHDGWMLYETQAIMRYVDTVVAGPRLQPEEPRAAARMNQLMGITDWYVMRQVSVPITRNRVVAPRVNQPVDEAEIVKAIPPTRASAAPRSPACSMAIHGWRGTRSASPICCSRRTCRCLRRRRKARRYCRS